MSGITLALGGLLFFAAGYLFYSRFIANSVYRLSDTFRTPAHEFQDGVDFVPTNKHVLLGHHFTSIAGAAPILGPAIALFWGWLPAILWVLLGTIFAAGVHDFGALVISTRHKGQSMGTLARWVVGKRARILFLFIILFLVLMVNAVFSWVIANLFISFPASVVPVFIEIPLALWIGWIVHKNRGGLLIPSIVALVVMYGFAVLSSYITALQVDMVGLFGGKGATVALGFNSTEASFFFWIAVLMAYGYIASILPVWRLLQPRDFINSHQLFVALAALYGGVLVLNPEITAPAVNPAASSPSWFPLLFITIACGAISGFHGLVASGTTSKQLDKETDAREVGYLGSLGEGALALISIVAVGSLFATQGEFLQNYSSFQQAGAQGLGVFVKGAARLTTSLGIPVDAGRTIVAVIVVSFAATSLDTSFRLMRYIIAELGSAYDIKPLTGVHVATSISVFSSAALALLPRGPRGFGSGGFLLWPLFGTSNQLLAGITLLIITIWLKRQKRNYMVTLIPMVFILIMTVWAMTEQVFGSWLMDLREGRSPLLFIFGSLILSFALWILVEAWSAFTGRQDHSAVPD